jgi:hypothetical protein
MKIVVRVADVARLAKRFEDARGLAMLEVVEQMRAAVAETLEHVMKAELDVFSVQVRNRQTRRMDSYLVHLALKESARSGFESPAIELVGARVTSFPRCVAPTWRPRRTSCR